MYSSFTARWVLLHSIVTCTSLLTIILWHGSSKNALCTGCCNCGTYWRLRNFYNVDMVYTHTYIYICTYKTYSNIHIDNRHYIYLNASRLSHIAPHRRRAEQLERLRQQQQQNAQEKALERKMAENYGMIMYDRQMIV